MKRIAGAIGFVVLGLIAWTVYANVMTNDPATLAAAEVVADAACGSSCKHTRVDGTSSVLGKTFVFTYPDKKLEVACRRPYIAFGGFRCTVAK